MYLRRKLAGSSKLFDMVLLAIFALAALLPDEVHGLLEKSTNNTSTAFASDMAATLCNSGTELATALASAAVQFAYVPADIVMTDADWANYTTPFTLWRNVTISGTSSDANKWPLLDLGFTLNKVKLGSGVMLRFNHIAIKNWRKGAYFQAPGLDLVATNPDTVAPDKQAGSGAAPAPAPGLLMFETMAYIQRSCFPPAISSLSTSRLERPSQLPGEQLAARLPADPTCVNDTSAPVMRRCWAARGAYWDMAALGFNFDDAYNPVPAGFNIWYSNTQYKCEIVMAEECINKVGPVACYYRMFPRAAGSPLIIAGDGAPAGGSGASGGGGGSSLLAPLLGGLLGGVVLAGVVGVAAFMLLRRRQLRQAGGMPHPSSDDGTGPRAKAQLESEAGKAAADERRCSSRYLQPPTAAQGKGGVSIISDGGGGKDAPSNNKLHGSSVTSAGATTVAGGSSSSALPLTAQHGAASISLLCGPDPYGCMHPISSSTTAPVMIGPGISGEAAAAGGGSGCGADSGLTPSTAGGGQRLGSQTCMHERGGPSASLSQPRCTSDELALLPVTPLTPLQPGVNLNPIVVGATVKLLPVTLGKGAFGRVVEGQYDGQRVAVKLLNTGLLTGTEELTVLTALARGAQDADGGDAAAVLEGPGGKAMGSLIREVEVLARCQHPNIVRLLAASLVPPRICLVMELMDTSLDRLLHGGTTRRRLPLPTVIHIAVQIARALSYLHPTVLHRDLKPANVLISQPHSETPLAKLADFGVSRLQTTVHATKNADVGTAQYVAPESFEVLNSAMTDRAEIYAFGVILWEMLTGERPWHRASTAQIAFAVSVLNSRLPLGPLSEERCPHKLRALLVSCWEKDPDRRPAAAEVVKALVLAQEALLAVPSSSAVGSEGPLISGIKGQHHHPGIAAGAP